MFLSVFSITIDYYTNNGHKGVLSIRERSGSSASVRKNSLTSLVSLRGERGKCFQNHILTTGRQKYTQYRL